MTDVFVVVCTNRGAHKLAKLTRIGVDADGSPTWRVGNGFYPPGLERADGKINEVYVFDCWRCPRTLELTEEKFQVLGGWLLRLGVSRLDISELPF